MHGVNERVPGTTASVIPDRLPPWYRRLWFVLVVLGFGVILLIAAVIVFVQAGAADTETEALLANAAAAATSLAEREIENADAAASLDGLRQDLTNAADRQTAAEAETANLQADLESIESRAAEATVSLTTASASAVALRDAVESMMSGIDGIVAADGVLSEDLTAALEAGNKRDLDGMNRHFDSSGSTLEDLRTAFATQEERLTSVEVLLFDAGGMTADGVLATESFEDPESGWTVYSSDGGSADYVDGTYQVEARLEGIVEIGYMPISIGNVGVEVDARAIEPAEAGGYEYGIFCIAHASDTVTEGYLLSVGATHVRIAAFGDDGVYQELTSGQNVLAETTGARRIGAVCTQERIALYVDGEAVAETAGIGLEGTEVGLLAVTDSADPVTVQFDDLRLVHPTLVGGTDGE